MSFLKNISGGVILSLALFVMLLIVVFTNYAGSTDVADYSHVAKFFAGKYQAKIRSSHSYFYGFLSFPFVKITESFLGMKFISFVWLVLIILSLFLISKKNKKSLLLIISAPIFWYMAPWISPIQISALLFLWGYYFIRKYDEKKDKNIRYLIYSGLFVGLSWVFWDTMLYFGVILTLVFLLNKKFYHFTIYLFFILVGLSPRLILDQILFNFPFFTILKSFMGGLVNSLWGGISGTSGHSSSNVFNILIVLIMLPVYSFLLLKLKYFRTNKKTVIFLILSLFLILLNPQIRYTLILTPIILLNLFDNLTERQFKIQVVISLVLSLLVITPYLIQINYETNGEDINLFVKNINSLELSETFTDNLLEEDLIMISKDFPNEKFVVGNKDDSYLILADVYWGSGIDEFVSIQDYRLFLEGDEIIFEKEFHPKPNINNRREIWIKGGLSRNTVNDKNLSSVKYAISDERQIDLNGFELVKSYNKLNVFKKR